MAQAGGANPTQSFSFPPIGAHVRLRRLSCGVAMNEWSRSAMLQNERVKQRVTMPPAGLFKRCCLLSATISG